MSFFPEFLCRAGVRWIWLLIDPRSEVIAGARRIWREVLAGAGAAGSAHCQGAVPLFFHK
jgi:hypothetical protein